MVRTLDDPRFERAGNDLLRTETISVPDAVLGTVRRVPTLEAPVEVSIPAGVQPDTVLRVSGQGLPGFGGQTRGDLLLRLRLVVPVHPAKRVRELYEHLRQLEPGGAPSP